MIVHIEQSFEKDWQNLRSNKTILNKAARKLFELENASKLSEVTNVKHLRDAYYRIRIGDYRIGFRLIDNEILIERLGHRSDIYRKYPPH